MEWGFECLKDLPRASAKAPAFMPGDEAPLVRVLTTYLHMRDNGGMKLSSQFRLTEEARALLDARGQADGISHTAMLEIAIREAARKRGIHTPTRIQAIANLP